MEKRNTAIKYVKWILILAIILSLGYLYINSIGYEEDSFAFDDDNMQMWNESWDVNYDGRILQNVSLPIHVPVKPGGTVILRKTLPDKIKEYNCLMMEGMRQDITVSIGGIERYSFSTKAYRPWGKTSPTGALLVPLYNTDSREDVAIHIKSDSEFSGRVSEICLGNEKSLLVMIIKRNVLCFSAVVIAFILGIICLVCFYIYRADFQIGRAMKYLAYFSVLSAVWGFSQSGLRQLFVNDLTTLEAVGYCAYMLMGIPLLLYVNWITQRAYNRSICCYVGLMALNFVLENFVMAVLGIGFFEMRLFTQLLLFGGVVIMIGIYIQEIREGRGAGHKALIIGTIGFMLGLLSERYFQAFRVFGENYNKFILGALVFIGAGFLHTSICISREQKQKKNAESANLAKSLFLATMSHEIKTPINTVLGMNELIIRDAKEDMIREYAENIHDAGKSLLALVNDILDFSKIESGKMDIICVNYQTKSLLQDLIMMTENRIKQKGLKLNLNIDPSIPAMCYGDEIRIKQVVTNLLTNAAKYTKEGEVTFTVKNLGVDEDTVSLFFSVRDTGVGIRGEDIERFMDPFVRVDQVKNSNVEGTGLGLSITSKLLEMMSSKLKVDSIYGQGSDFSFVLQQKIVDKTPMGSIAEKVRRRENAKKITFRAPSMRVLAVDDNRMNLKVLVGILQTTQMQIDICESGAECLALCKENHYDIIFMDHMMPGMDGIETLKQLKADEESMSREAIVFVLTANTVSGASELYMESGFDYYLKKPIDLQELNEVMRRFIPKDKLLTEEDK